MKIYICKDALAPLLRPGTQGGKKLHPKIQVKLLPESRTYVRTLIFLFFFSQKSITRGYENDTEGKRLNLAPFPTEKSDETGFLKNLFVQTSAHIV